MDPVANMLTQLRNESIRKRPDTEITVKGKVIRGILEILERERFIEDFEEDDDKFTVRFRYRNGQPVLNELRKISKGGLRKYVGWRELRPVLRGRGIGIISTSKGILTVEEARDQKVGGEYICKIW
jgi:small subunit ribosomal protein S8